MEYGIETRCCHGVTEIVKEHSFGAVSVPIYQTATFAHRGIGESTGHDYTRVSNPTRDELEQTISSLEGALDTVACATGMAAISLVLELFDTQLSGRIKKIKLAYSLIALNIPILC